MKYLSLILLASTLLVGGCSNTSEGIQKDASENGQKVSDASEKASGDLKSGTQNAGAALSLTPAIKAAIVANPFLSENGNLIDVDTTADEVTLKGHVKTDKARTEAEDLARKIMTDKSATQTLKNELIIQP